MCMFISTMKENGNFPFAVTANYRIYHNWKPLRKLGIHIFYMLVLNMLLKSLVSYSLSIDNVG